MSANIATMRERAPKRWWLLVARPKAEVLLYMRPDALIGCNAKRHWIPPFDRHAKRFCLRGEHSASRALAPVRIPSPDAFYGAGAARLSINQGDAERGDQQSGEVGWLQAVAEGEPAHEHGDRRAQVEQAGQAGRVQVFQQPPHEGIGTERDGEDQPRHGGQELRCPADRQAFKNNGRHDRGRARWRRTGRTARSPAADRAGRAVRGAAAARSQW
jgi:hypothetical protein